MKNFLVLIMTALTLTGCLSPEGIPDSFKDPGYRDSVLLASGVASYDLGMRQDARSDMRGMSDETLRFLKYVYAEYAELAVVSEYAYKDGSVTLPEGWVDLGTDDLEISSIINRYAEEGFLSVGLKCSLLARGDRYVLAFAGTDLPADWKDFKQILSFLKDAYENVSGAFRDDAFQVNIASVLVEKLIAEGKVSLDNLEFAGHSLGGRIASEMAVRYARPATVFNAAGVAPSLYGQYEAMRAQKPEGWKGYIVDITSANDFLTNLQTYVTGLSEKRDYRSIGAHLHLGECLTGHAINPMSSYLYARSEACEKELKSR